MTGWIPMTEQLPPRDERVLGCTADGWMSIGRNWAVGDEIHDGPGGITHWMPLPEPPDRTDRVKKHGEVFTPEATVKQMCDLLEEQNSDEDPFLPEATFLEPSCGDGAFVVEILRRKFDRCRKRADYTAALESVYGFELLADNVARCIANVVTLCEERFRPTRKELETIHDHIIQCDSLKVMKLLNRMKEDEG